MGLTRPRRKSSRRDSRRALEVSSCSMSRRRGESAQPGSRSRRAENGLLSWTTTTNGSRRKSQLQMERARKSRSSVIRLYVRSCGAKQQLGGRLAPHRRRLEPLSEYLLARNGWSYGEGLLSTITLLFPKAAVRTRAVPPGYSATSGLGLGSCGRQGVPAPESNSFRSRSRSGIRRNAGRASAPPRDWRVSFDWAEGARDLITDRAYAGFLATQVAPQAARQHDWRALPFLLRAMITRGAPKMWDFALFFAMWSVPQNFETPSAGQQVIR